MGLKSDLNFTEIHWPMSQITLRRNGLYLGKEKSWNLNGKYFTKPISFSVFHHLNFKYSKESISIFI